MLNIIVHSIESKTKFMYIQIMTKMIAHTLLEDNLISPFIQAFSNNAIEAFSLLI